MNKKISLFVLIILTLSLFRSSPAPVHAVTWWNTDWSYRIDIEINRTKIEDDFIDFPVLVYLNSSRINWFHVKDNLADLRFIDSDEITQLYAELENYTINNEAWIWVKIPVIYSMGIPETNQEFYLYYGNNAVSSWWNPEDVWDSSAIMVQHLYDNPDASHIMDSTNYNNDGIKKGANEPIETDGKIGNALSFDGGNDYVLVNDADSLKPTTAITIMVWINPINVNSGYRTIVNKNYEFAWEINQMNNDLQINCNINGVYRSNYLYTTLPLVAGVCQQIVFTFNGVTGCIYFNGLLKSSRSDINGALGTSTYKLSIGARDQGKSLFFYGVIDEIRIYNRALSAAEVKANYNSGDDSLLLYGAESLVPLALTIRYNIGIKELYVNGTQRANNTTIYIDKNANVNVTAISQSNYIFYRHILGLSSVSLIPMYLFNMTQPFTLWSYATPNFYIYEEPSTFTFSQWMLLLFITLGIALLAAIKFHAIAVASFILTLYMIINVAEFESMILLAIIVWLLTIMFSIIAFMEL